MLDRDDTAGGDTNNDPNRWAGGGGRMGQAMEVRARREVILAGGTLVKPPQKVFWGGYSGYFKDPDGHLWEVTHNPLFWVGPEDAGESRRSPLCSLDTAASGQR